MRRGTRRKTTDKTVYTMRNEKQALEYAACEYFLKSYKDLIIFLLDVDSS